MPDQWYRGVEKVDRLKYINAEFEKMHQTTTLMVDLGLWKLEEYYGIKPDNITTTEHHPHCSEVEGSGSRVGLNDCMMMPEERILAGFYDGASVPTARAQRKKWTFEQVRGDFESNPFVTAVLKHIEDKTALGDELIGRMQRVSSFSP